MTGIWNIQNLPINGLESKAILKLLPKAHAALAELKGIGSAIPNQNILINTLGLQEAKDSSAIENIITTHDELYKVELNLKKVNSLGAKEVQNYIAALKRGARVTAANYLNKLAKDGVLVKEKVGNENYYINQPLVEMLSKR